jgi:hypothetical protein
VCCRHWIGEGESGVCCYVLWPSAWRMASKILLGCIAFFHLVDFYDLFINVKYFQCIHMGSFFIIKL